MENSFQTSFIPKKPITTSTPSVRRSSTSLVSIFFVLLLVGMGIAAGGLFFYRIYLQNQQKVLSDSLTTASSDFDLTTVQELELFDKRVTVSKQILSSHIILSPLFALLGSLTIPSVQYTKFSQDTDDTNGFSVQLSGVAQDYKSIALQADAFNSDQGHSFKNVVFSNLTKDTNGNVDFDVEFTVDPALLSYEKNTGALSSETAPTQDSSPIGQATTLPTATAPVTDTTIGASTLPAAQTDNTANANSTDTTSTASSNTNPSNTTTPNSN